MAASTHGSGSGGHGGGLSPYELVLLVFVGAVAVFLARELLSSWQPADAGTQVADTGSRLRSLVLPVAVILAFAIGLLVIARRIRKRRDYLLRRYASAVRPVMPRTYKSSHLRVRRWFGVRPRKMTISLPPECEVDDSAWRDRVVMRLEKGVGESLTARWPGRTDPLLRAQPRVVIRPERKGLVARAVMAVLR